MKRGFWVTSNRAQKRAGFIDPAPLKKDGNIRLGYFFPLAFFQNKDCTLHAGLLRMRETPWKEMEKIMGRSRSTISGYCAGFSEKTGMVFPDNKMAGLCRGKKRSFDENRDSFSAFNQGGTEHPEHGRTPCKKRVTRNLSE